MTHTLPFTKFKEYIQEIQPGMIEYMNLYCLNEIYKKRLLELLYKTRALKNKYDKDNVLFDALDCDDVDFKTMLFKAGMSMRNILEYVKQNYKTHFKGITIDKIEMMGIPLVESQRSS
jgi:hypothetical protein